MENNLQNTHIFTNKNGNTLIKEFEGVMTNNPTIKYLDAVVGFLRVSGYYTLRPFLDGINRARILVGIDVDRYMVDADRRGKLFFGAEEECKEECLQRIKHDIEHSGYKQATEQGILQVVQDLADGKLELRAHPSKRIHAKIYVLYPDGFNQYQPGLVITGSSNLSGNGLGIGQDKQYEFNVKLSQFEDVAFAKQEFETLWEEAENCEITANDVDAVVSKTYIKNHITPYEVYIKMLMEYFSDRALDIDSTNPLDMPAGYTRYDYQMDAVEEGYKKMLRYNGFFLADVVGLGKTVIATMIAKKFLIENGRDNTKILVVYPPAVEQNWKATFHDFGIDIYTKFISNGSLSHILDNNNLNYWNADEYDLVIVDEAHKYRSSGTQTYEYLQAICKIPRINQGNIKGYRKKVMLVSATPMNNSPADIYNQILLFQDARCCTIDGVANLTAFFSPIIIDFDKLRHETEFNHAEFRRLSDRVRNRIIKPLTVRRTRSDIESTARYNRDINGFPKVERPVATNYELNDHLATLFEKAMHTLTSELSYARYQAIAYLKPEAANGRYDNADLVSHNLAGIRKNGLVKRLESSFYAFKCSVERFKKANENMINMLGNNKVYIANDLDINKMIEDGVSEELIEEKLNEKAKLNPKNAIFTADNFKPEYMEALLKDQALLQQMHDEWETVTDHDDSKFAKFEELLNHELFDKDRNKAQKLVVFSESIDTVEYLYRRLNRNDVLWITSTNRKDHFKEIRENFDANYPHPEDKYNIILTTDVLAEGVNLHRSNVIVNYDTPWNATRLMQRIGRVNRIGSVSKHIYNYVFYPSRQGNREINLNQIALSKLQTFHTTFGEDNQIYSQQEVIERDIDKLFDASVHLEQDERNPELEYLDELRTLYKNNRREYERIASLSLRSRAGRESRSVNGTALDGNTLVFLKTNFRKVFFLVSAEAVELSAIDALKYFKASIEEQPVALIAEHHDHVAKALQRFRILQNEEINIQESTMQTDISKRGAQLLTAVSLINALAQDTYGDVYSKMMQLKALVERGVISHIAKRLQQLQHDLQNRRTTRNDAQLEVEQLAQRYAPYYIDEVEHPVTETDAEIILSESFKHE